MRRTGKSIRKRRAVFRRNLRGQEHSSDDTHFVVKNEFASLDAIAETYFPDEKIRKNFIASYQAYSEYFAMDESGTIEGMEHPCPVMLYYRQSHFTCSTRIRGEAMHMGMGQSEKWVLSNLPCNGVFLSVPEEHLSR